jgi:hypothetical protein
VNPATPRASLVPTIGATTLTGMERIAVRLRKEERAAQGGGAGGAQRLGTGAGRHPQGRAEAERRRAGCNLGRRAAMQSDRS